MNTCQLSYLSFFLTQPLIDVTPKKSLATKKKKKE